jgi:hypothetical protein
MAMTPHIQAAIRGFNDIILRGVPLLLKQNETAFLSFMFFAEVQTDTGRQDTMNARLLSIDKGGAIYYE